jgi:hypothetical protein
MNTQCRPGDVGGLAVGDALPRVGANTLSLACHIPKASPKGAMDLDLRKLRYFAAVANRHLRRPCLAATVLTMVSRSQRWAASLSRRGCQDIA